MENAIDGVVVKPLKTIPDDRGCIYHMLRSDDEVFTQFGEIYFSKIFPDVVKGWHVHTKMTLNYAVPVGKIKLVLYDQREGSATKGTVMEIVLGEDDYKLVSVPPGVVNGFTVVGGKEAVVANCSTHPHDPEEIKRIDPFENDIPYTWDAKHGG